MIIIGILFGFIICFEWRYLRLKRRKLLTYRFALGTAVLLFLGFEALYYFREQWVIAGAVQTIFGPVEKIIRVEK